MKVNPDEFVMGMQLVGEGKMKTISIRLDEKTLKRTRELADFEHLKRSAALRQSIAVGLDALCKKIAVEKYANKIFSLSEAARFANVSAGEMIDLLVKKGVKSNYSIEDAEQSFKRIGKLAGKTG